VSAQLIDVSTARPMGAVSASRPAVPEPARLLLRRPELEDRIMSAAARRLLLVTAPAGYGKRSVVAEALRGSRALAWASVDETDRTPVGLACRVLAAVTRTTGAPFELPTSLVDLDRALAAACHGLQDAGELSLVLDDPAGVLQGEAAGTLRRLLAWLPPAVGIVVLARRRPAVLLARLRSRGEVAEIDASALAFTPGEVHTYLSAVWELGLDDAATRQIASWTEGWPLALGLVATRLAEAPDRHRLAERLVAGDGDAIAPLVRELLVGLAPSDWSFLADISVLEQLAPERCRYVTGYADAAPRLARLADEGALVVLDTDTPSYRHRSMLQAHLHAQLQARDPDREADLHRAAFDLASAKGERGTAIRHGLAAGNGGLAADLLEEHLSELLSFDGGGWVRRTLSELSPIVTVERPTLRNVCADLSLLSGDRDALELQLASLEDPAVPVQDRRAGLARVRAHLSRLRGDGVEPLLVHRQTDQLDPEVAHPLGVALAAEGRHEAASTGLRCALDDARGRQEPLRELMVLADLAWQRTFAGHLIDADLLCRRATDLARGLGLSDPPLAVQLARAQIALDRGMSGSARELSRSFTWTHPLGHDLAMRAAIGLFVSRARWTHHDSDGARRALAELDRDLRDSMPGGGLVAQVARAKASLYLALGDVDGALEVLPGVTGAADHLPPGDRIVAAGLHLKLGDAARARELIASLAHAGIGPRLTIHALRTQAAASEALGDRSGAARSRRRAEDVAQASALLKARVMRATSPAAGDGAPASQRVQTHAAVEVSAQGAATEQLTPRELVVLRMLPTATNAQIASELFVTVNTVKTHLKSINRKLGVSSRDSACRWAAAAGVL
jgi:LuxR family transcriptional regulator, maltose regulon positive regulatory protein